MSNPTPNKAIEEARRKIEKILWREYNPNYAPNMEEVSEEIIGILNPLILSILTEALPPEREIGGNGFKMKEEIGIDVDDYDNGFNACRVKIKKALKKQLGYE